VLFRFLISAGGSWLVSLLSLFVGLFGFVCRMLWWGLRLGLFVAGSRLVVWGCLSVLFCSSFCYVCWLCSLCVVYMLVLIRERFVGFVRGCYCVVFNCIMLVGVVVVLL